MPKPKRNINAVAEDTLTPPGALSSNELICRIKIGAGKNLYHLERPDGTQILAELAQKFRSTIWMKRGAYVVVDTAAFADRDNKLDGEIVNLVGDEKAWRKKSFWPPQFVKRSLYEEDSEDDGPQMPSSDEDEE